jgi:two-component system, sporulation sensor kinase C
MFTTAKNESHIAGLQSAEMMSMAATQDADMCKLRLENEQLRNQIADLVRREQITDQHAEELAIQYHEELERIVEQRATEIRRLERQRLEAEKQIAVGRMAARIAHEINNPLAGVQNSFLLVKRGIAPDFKYFEYVGRIEKEIERVARIVRQMFTLYKPHHTVATTFRPADVIRDVAAMLDGACRSHGVNLHFEFTSPEMTVHFHEDSLRQILFNLMQNAVEASPPESAIRVATHYANRQLVLLISDHGRGITPTEQERIFEPFFTTKSDETSGGLGLGLSIARGIIESLGGKIEFSSQLGKGTTFEVSLPAELESGESPAE